MSIRACVAYLQLFERLFAARAHNGELDEGVEAGFASDLNDLRAGMTEAEEKALDEFTEVWRRKPTEPSKAVPPSQTRRTPEPSGGAQSQ